MNSPSHAGSTGTARAAVRTAAAILAGGLVLASAAWAAMAVRVAKRVVTPAKRPPDAQIVAFDTAAQTITLSRTADTTLPGRYGLFTTGSLEYVRLGSVLAQDASTVKRKLLTHVPSGARLGRDAVFSGWYYDHPDQLQLPYTSELIGSPLGPCPAWLFPGATDSDVWVIQVHGRGTNRTECLRAVPVFHDLGITSLLVSYRNDGVGPRGRGGTYTLGATEWRDVGAAIGFAQRRGAKRIVLMGWSMGGAIVLQTELSSAHRDAIHAIVLDSPVIDWQVVLDFQIQAAGLPHAMTELAMGAMESRWASGLTGLGEGIPFSELDILSRARELRDPILILHSDDDGFVPSDGSHDLVVARPDIVTLQVFEQARHTKLWNYDQDRWTRAITEWLQTLGLASPSSVEPDGEAGVSGSTSRAPDA